METITDATTATFAAEALQTEAPVVLVDFWAPWCAPCRALTPALEALAGERDDMKLVKVNTDEEQSLAASYGVMGLPTVVILREGRAGRDDHAGGPEAAARGADRRSDRGVGGRRRDASRAVAARRAAAGGEWRTNTSASAWSPRPAYGWRLCTTRPASRAARFPVS